MGKDKAKLKLAQYEAYKLQKAQMDMIEALLDRGTEEDAKLVISRAGLAIDSPAGKHALKVWRENSRR
jgi:hypothetical protein